MASPESRLSRESPPTATDRESFADATPRPFWLDRRSNPRTYPPLPGSAEVDLCVVGAGFTGLWAALQALERDPGRSVVVLDAETVGSGASGRNGGFLSASLTHGLENGLSRFPDEMPTLERLGTENFEGLKKSLERHGIGCDFEENGELHLATEEHQVEQLAEEARLLRDYGHDVELLRRSELTAEVASPTYRAGLWDKTGSALIDPAKLADGLATTAAGLGAEIHECTPVSALEEGGDHVRVVTSSGTVSARRVILATSAFPPLVPRLRRYIVPVYDYVLVTEPLSPEQLAEIGWRSRQGLADSGNRFHYYRLTDDDRILWGGYEAVYRYGGPVEARLDTDDETFAALARNFFTTFPSLRGIRFSHKWGGAIDTCSRFSSFFHVSHGGKAVFAGGYTGLGVGASRFGAGVALDLTDGRESEATALRYVASKPVPFPPEPLRWVVVQFTRGRLAAADRKGGRRGLWLRLLDRLGLGFDS